MARARVTVSHDKAGGWNVKTPSGVQHFDTKAPAVDHGRSTAKSIPGDSQLQVRGRDGKIQFENTYRHDPKKYPS